MNIFITKHGIQSFLMNTTEATLTYTKSPEIEYWPIFDVFKATDC